MDWGSVVFVRSPPPSGAGTRTPAIPIAVDPSLGLHEFALESGGKRTVFRTGRSLRDVIRPSDRDAAWFHAVRLCAARDWERARAAGLSDVSTYLVLLNHLGTNEPDAFRACPRWARDLLGDVRRLLVNMWQPDRHAARELVFEAIDPAFATMLENWDHHMTRLFDIVALMSKGP